jgi:hypothetical protein
MGMKRRGKPRNVNKLPFKELTEGGKRFRLIYLIQRLGDKKIEVLNRIAGGENGLKVWREVTKSEPTGFYKMMKSEEAIRYLEAIMSDKLDKLELTIDEIIGKFRETYEMAKDEKEFKPMIDATRGLGDIIGVFKAVDNSANILAAEAMRLSDDDMEETKRLAGLLGLTLTESSEPALKMVASTSVSPNDIQHSKAGS